MVAKVLKSELAKKQSEYGKVQTLLRDLGKHKSESSAIVELAQCLDALISAGIPTLTPLLPAFLSLKGRPYTIDDHFPFEPFFSPNLPRSFTAKAGRQIAKSTGIAAQGVIQSATTSHFNTLFITPLFETVRRLSSNYVREFIETSPVKRLITAPGQSANVLQRTFRNGSSMFFSYALLDVTRTRGINTDKCAFDEVQNMDETFIPLIQETMSGSPYGGISQFTGTPLTLDGTLEKLWLRSSQAEWVIDCPACHYENVPALSHDLVDMIGPWREDISEEKPGTICAKCKKPINPRTGRWLHGSPELADSAPGYHMPQVIFPMHYADVDKWRELLIKQARMAPYQFFNEVCGESYDIGAKLITLSAIRQAAVLHPNDINIAMSVARNYSFRVLSIDWGGGGVDGTSYTNYAVLGALPDGTIDVIYGYKSLTPHDFMREAAIALDLVGKFGTHLLAHDYCGAGSLREQFIVNAGYPLDKIVPCWYVPGATQGVMRFVEANPLHPRDHYKIDKPRSLNLTCSQIHQGRLRFFKYDDSNGEDMNLLRDFLALVEEKKESSRGRDIYSIVRSKNMTDDFAQAVNYGCCTIWHALQSWPNLATNDRFVASAQALEAMNQSFLTDYDQ